MISVFHRLARLIPSPVVIFTLVPDFFRNTGPDSEQEADTILMSEERYYRYAIPTAKQKWGGRMARIPRATPEINDI